MSTKRRPNSVWLDLAAALCLGIGVWAIWPLAADNSCIDQPMGKWSEVPWLATVSFVAGWGLVLAQSLIALRAYGVKSSVGRGLLISGALWALLFAFAVPFHWTWAFAMSMQFVTVICFAIVMGIARKQR